jgi:hypothetical protein
MSNTDSFACPGPQPEEAEPEIPEEKEEQEEATEVSETQQCPNCALLHTGEELMQEIALYCACSRPGTENGIPVAPEQVLAQYNSRPPMLNTRSGHPVYAAPAPIVTNPEHPVYAAPVPIITKPGRTAYAAPIPISPVFTAPRRCGCGR